MDNYSLSLNFMSTLNSSVSWVIIVGSFVVGGLNNIIGILPPGGIAATIVSVVLGIIGLYLHNGQIKAGKVGNV